MIVGIGTDLVEVARLGQALERGGERFERRVFTARERRDCGSRIDRVQALAARFAAKEACLKALGTGWSGGLSFRQVEVLRDESGAPRLGLHGAAQDRATRLGVTAIHVSLTHQKSTAGAIVILETALPGTRDG